MSHLEQLLRFLAATILVVTLSRPAAAMAPPEGPEQQQRVPRAPLTRIPRPVPAPPPAATARVAPPTPPVPAPAPAPAPAPVPKATDCAQMLLKGQPVDLSCCGEPGQITGPFVSTLIRGGFKDAAPVGPEGLKIANGSIDGDLDLSSSQFSYRLTFDNVEFKGKVECRECELGGHVNLRESTFRKAVDFGSAQVHRTMELEYAQFCEAASFAGMTVDGAVYLDNAVFATGADFTDLNVTGTVQAYNASFVDDLPRVDPARVACTDEPHPLCDVVAVRLNKKCREDRHRCNATAGKAMPEVKFQQADIEGSLILVDNHLGVLDARQLRAGHDLLLVRDWFDGKVDLSSSSVGNDLRLVAPALKDHRIGLDGMRYGAIMTAPPDTTPDSGGTWDTLRPIIGRSDFNRDVYKRLEEYFENRGEGRLADDVFIAMKKRERDMLTLPQRMSNLVQWAVLGYGRHPVMAFFWSSVAVFIGFWVFKESRMVPRDGKTPTSYSRFWYSLDAFLPLTHLDAVDEWAPRPDAKVTWFYFRCHQLLGWILIPLGLASITGIIK